MKKMLAVICFLFSINVFATPIKQIVFLGDSLSDNGNLYKLLLKIIPKSPPYYKGRFSNGHTWAEHLGKYYADNNGSQYKIYAMGGATAVWENPSSQFISPSILEWQITSYMTDSATAKKSDVLFSIWIGANDYFFDRNTDADVLTEKVTSQIYASITHLIDAGARNFLILNLPDLGRVPYARENGLIERLHSLSEKHNQKLSIILDSLKITYPRVKISSIDIYNMFNNVIDHPDFFNKKYHVNIRNVDQACWQGGYTLDTDDQQQLFRQKLKHTSLNTQKTSN